MTGGSIRWGRPPLCQRSELGISVADESIFSWHAIGGFDYKPWESVSLKLGYRVYDFDYENDDGQNKFELNARQHGPMLGVSFHF